MPISPLNKKTITYEGRGYDYVTIPYHRGRANPKKSKWTITVNDELRCFENAITNSWTASCNSKGWGIKIDTSNKLLQLGKNKFSECLKIAKFISGARQWHGYPGDHLRNVRDIPSSNVLACWRSSGYINKSQMSKLSRNILCPL